MLKKLGYSGAYRDQNISVSVLLENPLDYGLDPATLVFSVIVKDKQNSATALGFVDYSFFIIDEQNHIYNTKKKLGVCSNTKTAADDDEPTRCSDGLILVDFKPEFLFQDLRIAFYHEAYQQLYIIKLKY